MSPDVETVHFKEDGQQQTLRRVTTEDAVGEEHTYEFRLQSDGTHEYQGDGDPSEAALEALQEFERGDA